MLASAPLMRERLAKEARYHWRDAPGYSFEFKHMQKVWMQPKTRRGAPDLERVSLPCQEMKPSDTHSIRLL